MNEKAIMKYKKGRKLKKVTIMPDFILRLKGKHDASNSEMIAHAFVCKLQDKCQPLENHEALTAERLLHSFREEAGVLIVKIKDLRKRLATLPETVEEVKATDFRANRRTEASRQNIISEIQADLERLTQIHELINDINTALELRVSKIRNQCSYKIDAYSIGVKSVATDFTANVNFNGRAVEKYLEKHQLLDNSISRIVTSIYVEGDDDNEI